MVNVKDEMVQKKLAASLAKYEGDEDTQALLGVYLTVACQESDSVEEAVKIAEQALSQNGGAKNGGE